MARAPLQIARPLNIGAPAGSPPLIGGGPISAALMNPQPMTPQGPGMAPPTFSRQFPGPDPLANAPQIGGAPQVPPNSQGMGAAAQMVGMPSQGIGSRVGNFLGSDAALGLAAGILEGGTTGQALGRGMGYALAARQAAGQQRSEQAAQMAKAGATARFLESVGADPGLVQLAQQGYGGEALQAWRTTAGKPETTINVGGSGEGEKFYEELDKGGAQMFNELLTNGVQAENTLIKIGRLDDLLAKVPTGATASMKQMAGNFGLNTEGLDDIQAAQALINQLVPGQRPPGSGPMSDADLELFKQSLPRIINQPGGNRVIIETMRGIAEYTTAQGQIAAAVANREMSPAEGRRQLASLPNPLEQFRSGGAGEPIRRRYNPATGMLE